MVVYRIIGAVGPTPPTIDRRRWARATGTVSKRTAATGHCGPCVCVSADWYCRIVHDDDTRDGGVSRIEGV